MKTKITLILILLALVSCGTKEKSRKVSLSKEFEKSLLILADDLIKMQELNTKSENCGALFCKTCNDYHTRASEAVLPFAVAFKLTNNQKYLKSAVYTGNWLIAQQQKNGSWLETPSVWTGTTADQLLMMAAAYPILEKHLSEKEKQAWKNSIKEASDWMVENMNHVFASINYCATSTATLMAAYQVVPDSAYVKKAKELAMLVASKFDEDYFLTGEGNRIRGTKYGVDQGYSMDMSLWGMGLYAKLANDEFVNNIIKKSLERYVYFIYPDGSTDGSWGVRASKWTTYGSVTADGCQILFSLYANENPTYRQAALDNLNYLMTMRENGLLTYGPNYSEMFNEDPCNYPTFCRAKNLALSLIYGNEIDGSAEKTPTQKIGWMKNFPTMDLTLVRTQNFMTTVTGYRYKDIRRGADFKYMHRASGGSITNLWVENYGYLQASSQTEYHQWEMHYPKIEDALPLTPRIEFTDSNAYYTNLYEFDSHMSSAKNGNEYVIEARGELKDRNRWEGGVAYVLTHKISDNSVQKNIKLRFHGQKPVIKIVEPFIQYENTKFVKKENNKIEITGGKREFVFELLSDGYEIELGEQAENYNQPFPALKGYPVTIKVKPDKENFTKFISYKISVKK
ncbi:MAG: hypothetical protein ACEPO8_05845 [Rhodothermaceae bacterium]